MSRKTLYSWFNAWEQNSFVGLYNQPRRGRKPTFTPAQQVQIRDWTQQHPRQLKQVLQKVKEHWNIEVSTKTIKRVLKSMQMSWHRFRRGVPRQPDPQEYEDNKAQLEDLKRSETEGELELYYMDKSEFYLVSPIPYGWQFVGETIEIPSQRSKRLHVLGIMSRNNHLESYGQAINYHLGNAVTGVTGQGIYRFGLTTDELVGVIQNAQNLSMTNTCSSCV